MGNRCFIQCVRLFQAIEENMKYQLYKEELFNGSTYKKSFEFLDGGLLQS